jgi:hypothetical protein
MTAQPGALTRQQLYDRIRESSKEEVILEEMIRLGFWPDGAGRPDVPADLIRRRVELQREIADLHRQEALWRDPETALKEMHKRRKRAAMERRAETTLRNATARHERALAWHVRRQQEILYLGADVSAGLQPAADAGPLKPGLPAIASPKALADAIGISLGELRFLAFDRAVSSISHYQRFTIPKKTGGERAISAPMPRLKRAQYWVLDNLLARASIHDAAHGFVPGRSIVTNAALHVGRDVVVNLDLKDFFPTLTLRRVKGKFRGLGYPEPVATVLALLCTEPDVDELELDGERLFAARGPRRLPQGAPTSPVLTNLICLRLDARLAGLARSLGFTYTRYADDMTFSASGEAARKVGTLLKYVGEIVTAEGFVVHPDKTRVMRRGAHQEVTGLTVNERVAVPRDTLRRFRALLHQIDASGPAGKSWGSARDVLDAALGFAFFVRMVTPELGDALVARARTLAARHGATAAASPSRGDFHIRAARGETPLARWWTPQERPAPAAEPVVVAHQAAAATQAAPPPGPAVASMATRAGQPRPSSAAPAPVQGGAAPKPEAPKPRIRLATVGLGVLGGLVFAGLLSVNPVLAFAVLGGAVASLLIRRNRDRRDR